RRRLPPGGDRAQGARGNQPALTGARLLVAGQVAAGAEAVQTVRVVSRYRTVFSPASALLCVAGFSIPFHHRTVDRISEPRGRGDSGWNKRPMARGDQGPFPATAATWEPRVGRAALNHRAKLIQAIYCSP